MIQTKSGIIHIPWSESNLGLYSDNKGGIAGKIHFHHLPIPLFIIVLTIIKNLSVSSPNMINR